MNRPLTDSERCDLKEIQHIILRDMAVDAGPAVIFALGMAAEAIDNVLVAGAIEADDEEEAEEEESEG